MSDLDAAIRGQAAGPIVTNWVVVAEVIHEDGHREVEIVRDAELTPWACLGMLQAASARTHARLRGGGQ